MNQSNPIVNHTGGIVRFNTLLNVDSWDYAIDCVDFPVTIRPLFYQNDDGEFVPAHGVTNTGRDSQHHGIVVDRNRTEDESVIATVTDRYGTLTVKDVYQSLLSELKSGAIEGDPVQLYVAGNGGTQELLVKLDGMASPHPQHEIEMILKLQTSVDGTKQHSLNLSAWNTKDGYEIVGLAAANYNLATKHTTTIGDRHISMIAVINQLIKEWNDNVIPMMRLMFDCEFDANMAKDILSEVLKDAKIPELHIERINAGGYDKATNMFELVDNISAYMSENLSGKQERSASFKKGLSSSVQKMINKLTK